VMLNGTETNPYNTHKNKQILLIFVTEMYLGRSLLL
jgi:hypothetical protein